MALTEREEMVLRRAMDHAIAYREGVASRPVGPQIGPMEAAQRLGGALNDEPRDPVAVIDAIVADSDPGLLHFTSPGFFGFVIGASHPVGVAADLLVSAWGQNTAYAATTPAVVAMENAVCQWVIALLGLPQGSGAGIVTGATMGNAVGIMAARNALLRQANWDVERQGLFGAPEVQVVIGAEAHSATPAALRYAGFGAERVHRIPADDQGRMQVAACQKVMAGLNGPVLMILQAGHINSGAFDDFAALIPLARAKDAWVHVDGAFGLWVHAVPELAGRAMGVELADSWATDLHKWPNAPFDAGLVICRDRAPLVAAMSAHGAYLPEQGTVWDPADSVPELSRRARGVPSYAVLRTLGAAGMRGIVAKNCSLAQELSAVLKALPGVTVMNDVVSNQVAFRCGDGEAGDALTAAVLARVQADGRTYPTHGMWKGRYIIRVSISGYATTDVETGVLVEAVKEALDDLNEQVADA
ncbi:MAG: aminotransferase class V-fold PLP-dependent enzyme [Paracoccaceae bacterium]